MSDSQIKSSDYLPKPPLGFPSGGFWFNKFTINLFQIKLTLFTSNVSPRITIAFYDLGFKIKSTRAIRSS